MKIFLMCILFTLFGKLYAIDSSFCSSQNELSSVEANAGKSKKKDTTYWTCTTNVRLVGNQYAYSNWSAGGDNSIATSFYVDQKYVYKRDKRSVVFITDFGVGYIFLANDIAPVRKKEDKMNINIQANIDYTKEFAYSLVLDLKSQFANGYSYPNDSVVVSSILSPAYITLSAGFTFKPINSLSCFVSPISGKFTTVFNQELADKGSFGVTPAKLDSLGNVIQPGKRIRPELGLNFVFRYDQEVSKVFTASATVELHNNYFDERLENRWNFDLNAETKLIFKLSKRLTTNLFCRVAYDDDVRFPVYEEIDGQEVIVKSVPKFQFNESMGIGIVFNF